MDRQFYDVFLKPIQSKSFVSSCNNNWKRSHTAKPKQIYFPVQVSVCCMDTLLSDMCSCIKQTYVFCEAPILWCLLAVLQQAVPFMMLLHHLLFPVSSPGGKLFVVSPNMYVLFTSKQITSRNRYGLKPSVVLMGTTQFFKQAFNKSLIPFHLFYELCV